MGKREHQRRMVWFWGPEREHHMYRDVHETEVPLVKCDRAVLVHALRGFEAAESVLRDRGEVDILRLAVSHDLVTESSVLGAAGGSTTGQDLLVRGVHEVKFNNNGPEGRTLVGELPAKSKH